MTTLPQHYCHGSSRLRRWLLRVLIVPVLLAVLLLLGGGSARAGEPRPLTPAWFAARPAAAGTAGTGSSAQASAATVAQSLADMKAAAAALSAAQLKQTAAQTPAASAAAVSRAAAALHLGTVPDGLTTGGLAPDTSQTWQNATVPTPATAQTQGGGRTQVTVTQTGQLAVLYWTTFNIGPNTDLVFDQSQGGSAANTWVAFNRVTDPAARPSYILGTISAPGQVYIMNRNGIIFGAGSQVNVGALLASTADFNGGVSGFLANGIYSVSNAAGLQAAFTDSSPATLGGITVEAGAQITTAAPSSVLNGGGFVLLFGSSVVNNGAISAPQGQVALAAGQNFYVLPGYSSTGSGDALATTLGSQIAVGFDSSVTLTTATGAAAAGQIGSVTNTGLLMATQGDVTMVGHAVEQGGVAYSTTNTTQRGTIHLLTDTTDTTASVTLDPGSLTWVAPELDNTATALDSQRAALIATSASDNAARASTPGSLNDIARLADELTQSRIEITTGGTAAFAGGSLTMAQAGQVAVSAGTASVASGAAVDVSGVPNVAMPASSGVLTVNVQTNELRDSPTNRTAHVLNGTNLYVDADTLVLVAASSADSSDRYYTPGGLLEVSGYLADVGHSIAEWSTVGGTVTFSATQVTAQQGAVVNLAGGSLAYQGGLVNTSWLTSTSGQIYQVDTAPSALVYSGVYDGFTVASAKWGTSTTYVTPLIGAAQVWRDAYTVGRDAGSLILSAPTVQFAATIDAGAVNGAEQDAARPSTVSDPFVLAQNVVAQGGALEIGTYTAAGLAGAYATDVVLGSSDSAGASGGGTGTAWLSAGIINGAGLGALSVATTQGIAVAAPLTFAPGAQVSLAAPTITIAADITARGGSISLTNKLSTSSGNPSWLTAADGSAALTLAGGATLDLRGIWSNLMLDTADVSGIAWASGGSASFDSSQGVTLAAGSTIDVSAGGWLSNAGAFTGGKGGSVTLIVNDPNAASTTAAAPLTIAGTLRGYGASSAGTLQIVAPAVTIASAAGPTLPATTLQLTPGFFRLGFASYDIDGLAGMAVAPGTTVDVVAPTYSLTTPAAWVTVPTGGDPAAALTLALNPEFVFTPAKAQTTQRLGASLTLRAGLAAGGSGGALSIGAGAALTVDAGQSVKLSAYDSITIDGTVTAPGGSIDIVNTRFQDGSVASIAPLYALNPLQPASATNPGVEIWIGDGARLDVSGIAATALDPQGRRFGKVYAGGTISIGGIGGTAGDGTLKTTAAQIIVMPGASLLADGASAMIDPTAGTGAVATGLATAAGTTGSQLSAGNGGTIALSSYDGIFLEGTLRAAAGGATAIGGTLSIDLETPVYADPAVTPAAALFYPREIELTQATQDVLPATLQAGEATDESVFGQAWVSAQQVTSGGFGNLALTSRGLILFDGNVNLRTGQSITLSEGILADTQANSHVTLAAPYVEVSGIQSVVVPDGGLSPLVTNVWGVPTLASTSTLTVRADQIDLAGNIRLGTSTTITPPSSTTTSSTATGTVAKRLVSYAGFKDLTLDSTGDLRFLAASGGGKTTLYSNGDITLDAAQVYPASGVQAVVVAGYNYALGSVAKDDPFTASGLLLVERSTATLPQAPLSVGGLLTLAAGRVDQGGIVVAPLGDITLGAATTASALTGIGSAQNANSYTVTLLKGSITSVSAAGMTIPYGGTADNVTYTYDGSAVSSFNPLITLAGESVVGKPGSTVDLDGGGTLTGAAFVSGRGGSVDVLTTPLLLLNPASTTAPTTTLATDPVYAIVPGYDSGYAPITPVDSSSSYAGSVPATGQQITVGDGVPGLAAGTYTLLPSYYALLPGAFRVELTPTTATFGGAEGIGNGSYRTAAFTGTANTAQRSALAVSAIVTPGTAVRNYSEYNETSYSDFLVAQAATYDRLRPQLPEDAGSLVLSYPSTASADRAFAFEGDALFDPGTGGYSGTVDVTATLKTMLDIIGQTRPKVAKGATAPVMISAAALDRLGAPRLVIGGTAAYNPGAAGSASLPEIRLAAASGGVTVSDGAKLTGAEVFLLASDVALNGHITVAPGAVIDTLGGGAPPYDSSGTGLSYDVSRDTALLVSNGQLDLAPVNPTQRAASGSLTIDSGATIYAKGTIIASTEKHVSIAADARLGAATLNLDVPVVSIGTPATGVSVPQGLALSQAVLTRLLGGNARLGVPALSALEITADTGVDFYGTVDFAAPTLQELVLNTPSIYGQGSASDVATLSVGTLVWNGISVQGNGAVATSHVPQGIIAGGAGSGAGRLVVDAQRIVFGYPDGISPTEAATLDRTMFGFSEVDLTATRDIEFNNQGALAVYETQQGAGFTGTGGTLKLMTPVLTGASGAQFAITTGGSILIDAPAGGAPSTAVQAGQGAQLTLTAGGGIEVATTLALNAGQIAMTATGGDITLDAGATLDVHGPTVTLVDQQESSDGGIVTLESTTGDITEAAGATIDVGSDGAAAGTLSLTATGGTVALLGLVEGGAPDGQDGGSFALRANAADFAGINAALDAGGFTWSRGFDIATGDITVAGTITAHQVDIAASGGSLTVSGTIDASGPTPGSIALSAADNLTIAGTAVLDAHATVAQVDSSGNAIPASNRADVSLTATAGTLTLQPGATIDVSSATGTDYGTVELYAPRSGSNGIAVAAAGALNVYGASSIALYGMQTYVSDDIITQATIDSAAATDTTFIDAALANPALRNAVAGLSAYGSVFHLRPGVEFDSASPDGTLTVSGDLDLNGLRTASFSDGKITEPGVLILRAGGTLDVFGSITDGFGAALDTTSTANPDDNGWILYKGLNPVAEDIVVPTTITLGAGTRLSTAGGEVLNYAVTLSTATIAANTVIPTAVTLDSNYTVPSGGMVAMSTIYTATTLSQKTAYVRFTKGQLVPAGTVLAKGTKLDAGAVLPFAVQVQSGFIWPAGAPLSDFANSSVTLAHDTTLAAGSLIPAGSDIAVAGGGVATSIPLRPKTNGIQGQVLATAPLDAAGTLSWSFQLVGGADLASANTGAVQAASVLAAAGNAGNIVLSDPHYVNPTVKTSAQPGLSVIRTGTGDLSLIAGGSIDEMSLYGIYTAGAQSADVTTAYQAARGVQSNGMVLLTSGTGGYNYNGDVILAQAWYPTGGGNVLVAAQGDLTGDVIVSSTNGNPYYQSDAVGNWLWRQGGTSTIPTAWSINFGAYADASNGGLVLVGFTGIGALGGGNVTVQVGGNAGHLATDTADPNTTHAIDVVVASTGRVEGSTIDTTGGGTLTLDIGGALNTANTNYAASSQGSGLFGTIGNLRGPVSIEAQSIGEVIPSSTLQSAGSLVTYLSNAFGGPMLVLGDATASIETRGDLVLGGVIDPTEVATAGSTVWTDLVNGKVVREGLDLTPWFTLWQPTTAVDLFSAGGTLVPTMDVTGENDGNDMQILYPPTLHAVAATGNIAYSSTTATSTDAGQSLELMPSPTGDLQLIAAGSLDAAGLGSGEPLGIDISGAPSGDTELSTPFNPAWHGQYLNSLDQITDTDNHTNTLDFASYYSIFAFEADTPTATLHAADTTPARIYAATGDIIDLNFGETWEFFSASATTAVWYIGAKPADIVAGRDIEGGGSTSLDPVVSEADPSGLKVVRNLIVNDRATDVSVVSAGRDIFYANWDVAGPGTLLVSAGRNIEQNNLGSLESIGLIGTGAGTSRSAGAGIEVMAGVATDVPDWTAFAADYLDPANPTGVVQTYDAQLLAWLRQTYGYAGPASGAVAYFDALSQDQRIPFLLQVYYAELTASGTEYNDSTSKRYKSYVRGKTAIADLFPNLQTSGAGDITLYGGSGVTTESGGAISVLAPGGQVVLGLNSVIPPTPATGQPAAGLITAGSGDVDIFAGQSVLLGQSRVFTTYGGGITIWSAAGDVNAGVGSKTSQVYQAPRTDYDSYGDISLSPTSPTTGAGIATLASVAGVPAGDVVLVAPNGIIDLGEAGVRSTGNVSLAATAVVGTGGVVAAGKTSGLPTVAAPNVGALSSASASSAAASGGDSGANKRASTGQATPSIITVEVVSFGGVETFGGQGGCDAQDPSCKKASP